MPSADHEPVVTPRVPAVVIPGARLLTSSTEGFVLVDSLELRGAVPEGGRVLSSGEALWILDESWRCDGGVAIRRFARDKGIGSTSIQNVPDLHLRRLLAMHVERGELVVVREIFVPKPFPAPAVEKAAPAPPPPVQRAAPPPVAVAEAVVDDSAQLQVLWAAARDGVPFCEECAKAMQRAA